VVLRVLVVVRVVHFTDTFDTQSKSIAVPGSPLPSSCSGLCRLIPRQHFRSAAAVQRPASSSQLMSPSFRGLIRCLMSPAIARTTHRMAAPMYAQPRNGCLPPIQDTVDITIDLVPENSLTG
jgi:hypothetical protein